MAFSNPYRDLTNYYRGQRYLGGGGGGPGAQFAQLGDTLASAIQSIQAKNQQDKLDALANHLVNSTPELGMVPKAGDVDAGTAPDQPFSAGSAGLNLLLNARMKQQAIAKVLAPPVAKAGKVSAPLVQTRYGMMTPRQAAATDQGQARNDRLASTYGPRPQADSMKHLSDEIQSTYGQPLSYFTQAPEDHKHLDGDTFSVEGDAGTVRMPATTYQDYLARFNAIQGGTPRMLGAGTGGGAAPAPAGPGMSGSAVGSDPGNAAPVPAAPAGAAATGGKVKMLHPNGTPGMVPAEQVDAALAQGYQMAE